MNPQVRAISEWALNAASGKFTSDPGAEEPEPGSLTEALLMEMAKPGTRRRIAKAIIHYAEMGKSEYAKILTERTEGKVPDKIEHSGSISTGFTDEERAARLASLLDTARTRRDGPAAGSSEPSA